MKNVTDKTDPQFLIHQKTNLFSPYALSRMALGRRILEDNPVGNLHQLFKTSKNVRVKVLISSHDYHHQKKPLSQD